MAGRKVYAVVNPTLWRYTQAVEWEGKTFTHDEPVELTEGEYAAVNDLKVEYAGGEHQLVVKAEPRAAKQAEAVASGADNA